MSSVNHANVIIATPGHSVLTGYVQSLLATCALLGEKKLSFLFTTGYSSNVADAREVTLSGTHQNNIFESRPLSGQYTYDTILWIDSDIVWKPEDALKLIESDKDITTGVYLFADGSTSVYPERFKAGYKHHEVLPKTELEKVDGCGFGFVAVKSGVFEKMSRPWFQSFHAEADIEGTKVKFNMVGEDLSWCYKVQEMGHDIWFDPSVRVTHHKQMKLTWEGIQP